MVSFKRNEVKEQNAFLSKDASELLTWLIVFRSEICRMLELLVEEFYVGGEPANSYVKFYSVQSSSSC